MNSALTSACAYTFTLPSPSLRYPKHNFASSNLSFAPIRASAEEKECRRVRIIENIKRTARVVILTAVTTSMVGRFGQVPAMAGLPTTAVSEETDADVDLVQKGEVESSTAPLAELLMENTEAVEVFKALLAKKLENREDRLALKIVDQLVEAQPEVADWRFLKARILNEMDLTGEARNAFEEILKADPFNYEALFENALLMIRIGECEGVVKRLEEVLRIAEVEGKVKEARDVRLITAQMMFLLNYVDEALSCYDDLIKEDPNDFRTHFSKGMIYTMTNRNDEAKKAFENYKKLSPKKIEVQGFLRTPLSRMLIFGTSDPGQI